MSPKTVFFGMIGVVIVAILLGVGGFIIGENRIAERVLEVSNLKADQEVVQQEVAVFEDAQSKVEKYSSVLEIADRVLPPSKNQAELIAELKKFANDTSIVIQQISFESGEQSKNSATSQTTSIEGLTGVLAIPTAITFEPGLSYQELLNFLKKVEQNQRIMQVKNVSLTPDQKTPNVLASALIEINVFLKGSAAAPETPSEE